MPFLFLFSAYPEHKPNKQKIEKMFVAFIVEIWNQGCKKSKQISDKKLFKLIETAAFNAKLRYHNIDEQISKLKGFSSKESDDSSRATSETEREDSTPKPLLHLKESREAQTEKKSKRKEIGKSSQVALQNRIDNV